MNEISPSCLFLFSTLTHDLRLFSKIRLIKTQQFSLPKLHKCVPNLAKHLDGKPVSDTLIMEGSHKAIPKEKKQAVYIVYITSILMES